MVPLLFSTTSRVIPANNRGAAPFTLRGEQSAWIAPGTSLPQFCRRSTLTLAPAGKPEPKRTGTRLPRILTCIFCHPRSSRRDRISSARHVPSSAVNTKRPEFQRRRQWTGLGTTHRHTSACQSGTASTPPRPNNEASHGAGFTHPRAYSHSWKLFSSPLPSHQL